MKKILFLDIDGVLCCERSSVAHNGYPAAKNPSSWGKFDQEAILILRDIITRTGAGVVLTSSWRHEANIHALEYRLGVRVYGLTRTSKGLDSRGAQIDDWIKVNPGIEAFAILDDEEDFLPYQMDYLCRTSKRNGLLLRHYEEAMRLLGEKFVEGA